MAQQAISESDPYFSQSVLSYAHIHRKVIHKLDITSSIIMWNRTFGN